MLKERLRSVRAAQGDRRVPEIALNKFRPYINFNL